MPQQYDKRTLDNLDIQASSPIVPTEARPWVDVWVGGRGGGGWGGHRGQEAEAS